MDKPPGNAAWAFNEAIELLKEARAYVPENTAIAEEIDEALPGIQDALQALSKYIARSS